MLRNVGEGSSDNKDSDGSLTPSFMVAYEVVETQLIPLEIVVVDNVDSMDNSSLFREVGKCVRIHGNTHG